MRLGSNQKWRGACFGAVLAMSLILSSCGGSSQPVNGANSGGGSAAAFSSGFVTGSGTGGAASSGGPREPVQPGGGVSVPFNPGGTTGTTGGTTGTTGTTGATGGTTGTTGGTGGGSGTFGQYAIYVTESENSPPNFDPLNWGGVLGFFQESDGALRSITGIPTADLKDPVDLVFRESSSEFFVSNRHGNNREGGSGLAGSMARFRYDPVSRTFTPNGSFPVAGPPYQASFAPNGELFVAQVGPALGFPGGVQRFAVSDTGASEIGTAIGSGEARGVIVSPDGRRLYVTTSGTSIRQFDLTNNNAELTPVPVTGASLHFMAIRNNELYVPGVSTNAVHRFTILANDDLVLKENIPAINCGAVAFSPDQTEMLATGLSNSGTGGSVISRLKFDAATDRWVPVDVVPTTKRIAGILTRP